MRGIRAESRDRGPNYSLMTNSVNLGYFSPPATREPAARFVFTRVVEGHFDWGRSLKLFEIVVEPPRAPGRLAAPSVG